MKKLFALVLALGLIGSAHAVQQRTFVASYGNDAATCRVEDPCRSWAAAILVAIPGGEVVALDSAGYGPVVINKPVSLIGAPGVYSGISVFSGVGVDVNPGSGTVILRGLTITGVGGSVGILYRSGGILYVNDSQVTRFTEAGLLATSAGSLRVADSEFRDNGVGISINSPIESSLSTSEHQVNVRATVVTSIMSGNHTGIITFGNKAAAYVSGSTITFNTYGVVDGLGTIYSGGDNRLNFNDNDGHFSAKKPLS